MFEIIELFINNTSIIMKLKRPNLARPLIKRVVVNLYSFIRLW